MGRNLLVLGLLVGLTLGGCEPPDDDDTQAITDDDDTSGDDDDGGPDDDDSAEDDDDSSGDDDDTSSDDDDDSAGDDDDSAGDDDDSAGDDDDSGSGCIDADGDGYAAEACGGDDCDDSAPATNPGAGETCGNGVDDDCDGACVGCGLCGEHPLAWADAKLLPGAGTSTGRAVAPAGDVDGDGQFGLLSGNGVWAYQVDGAVYGTVELAAVSTALLSGLGSSIFDSIEALYVSAGDFDGDSVVDFVVGGNCYTSAAIVYGPVPPGSTVDLLSEATLVSYGSEGEFCVATSAGDVDNDGSDDLLMTTGSNDPVYLYSGPISTSLDGSGMTATIDAGAASISFGDAAVGDGDIDGDGYADIVVSDTEYPDGPGRVHVFYGPLSGERTADDADATLVGVACMYCCDPSGLWVPTDAEFGHALHLADVNGDGFDDVIVGAPEAAPTPAPGSLCTLLPGQTYPGGLVYVFFGPLSGEVLASDADVQIGGLADWDSLGYSVSAGDVDGNGLVDLIIGDRSVGIEGAAYVAYGPLSGDVDLTVAGARMVGEDQADSAGHSVAGVGDMNADGYDDIAVGATGNDEAAPDVGATYVLYGGPGW